MKMIVMMAAALSLSNVALATNNNKSDQECVTHSCNTTNNDSHDISNAAAAQANAVNNATATGGTGLGLGVGVGVGGQGGAGGKGGDADATAFGGKGGDVDFDAKFQDLGGDATAFGGKADSNSISGVLGSGNSSNTNVVGGGQGGHGGVGFGGDVDATFKDLVDNTNANLNSNTAYGVKGNVEGGDATAFGGNVLGSGNSDVDVKNTLNTSDVNVNDLTNKQGQMQGQVGVNVSENDNASSASNGDQVTNVQVGGEGAPLTATSQSVEGDSLTVDDHSSTTYRNRSIALALPGATADHGSTAACLESRRGWTFFGSGASGRTRTNEECDADRTDRREFEQCMDLARNYAALGLIDHAVAQMQSCGGVTVESEPFGQEFIPAQPTTVPALPAEKRIGG